MKTFILTVSVLAIAPALHAQYQAAPQLTINNPAPQNFQLTWQSKDQRPYFLEGSPDLTTWADITSTPVLGNGGQKGLTLTNTASKFFYRLREGAIRTGFNNFTLSANDDGSSGIVDLNFNINLFPTPQNPGPWSQCYVNNNGNITIGTSVYNYTPLPLQTSAQNIPDLIGLIAPFWADVDTDTSPDPESGAKEVTYGEGIVNGHSSFGANWIDVGYFNDSADKLNSFQAILISRPDTGLNENFDIEFNYNKILWETGSHSNSGGQEGYGGFVARCGITNGINQTIELTHSGETLKQLDTTPAPVNSPNYTTGLIYRSRNSTIPGRFVFQVRNGSVLGALTVDAGTEINLPSNVTTTTLAGSASDPSGGSVSVRWSVRVGSPAISFSNPNILNPTVSIPAGETAVLELTATSDSDTTIGASDIMNITR